MTFWLITLAWACGTTDATPVTEYGPEHAFTLEISALRRDVSALKVRATQDELEVAERLRRHRHTASILRVLALRASDPAILADAKAHLRVAATLGRGGDSKIQRHACEATCELVALEAHDASNLVAARELAETLKGGPCAAEALQLNNGLSAYSAKNAAADWLDRRSRTESATLQKVAVYGLAAESNGKDPAARSVRVVSLFNQPVKFTRRENPSSRRVPRRITFSFENTSISKDLKEELKVTAAGLRGVLIDRDETSAELSFQLSERAKLHHYFLSDPFRLVVDVTPSEDVASDVRAVQTVVLDPGHGGRYDRGAKYEELSEADLVLDLAFRVAADLTRRMPRLRVLLTRQKDKRVTLEQRVAMANASGADLFVSIHLNSATEHVKHGGVTTFVLDTADDEQALKLAARENGTSIAQVKGLSKILANLHRQEQVRASNKLAALVHQSTLRSGRQKIPRLSDRGVRKAMFYVLVGARMPAVLLEASFLTRRQEAEALRTDGYREALATGISDGIVRYARGE